MNEPSLEEMRGAKKPRKKKGAGADARTEEFARMLPCDADAEKAGLSCALQAQHEMMPFFEEKGVVSEWFHIPAHSLIWDALVELHGAKKPFDFTVLCGWLRDRGQLDDVGGHAAVSDIFHFAPTAARAGHYLEILAEKYAGRRIIKVCTEGITRAYEEPDDIGSVIDETQAAILAVNRPDADASSEHIKPIKDGVMQTVMGIEEMYAARGAVIGLSTGIHQLDRMTGGLRGPLLIVPAGRPSMGKSALMWGMAEHMAIGPIGGEMGWTQKPVLGFSLEMSLAELAQRSVLGRAGINLQRLRDGFLSQHQMENTLPYAATTVAKAPIFIDDTPGISIQELRVRVRRFIRKQPTTAAVFIDYIQLMSSNSKRAKENRSLEIAEITSGLKNLAKEINRPIIAAAQLNRDNDGANALPKLSNLRESGSIEQDADMVLLLHRRHYYTKADEDKGKATMDLAKQRNGPTGPIELIFNNELARFENPEGQHLYSNNSAHRQGGAQHEEEDDEP